jgi:hypothetical protein
MQEQPETAGDAGAAAPAEPAGRDVQGPAVEYTAPDAGTSAPQIRAAEYTAPPAAPDTRPPLTTGALSERLGFIVAAGFIERLGITPAPRPEGSKSGTFWRAADFPAICDALVAHINSVRGAA